MTNDRAWLTTADDAVVMHGPLARLGLGHITSLETSQKLIAAYEGRTALVEAFPPPAVRERRLRLRLRPTRSEVLPLYEAGFSIVLHDVASVVAELAPIVHVLERDLRLPRGAIVADAFCSRDGSGAAPHFDSTSSFNCQLQGEKTWWLAPNPAVRFPPVGLELGLPTPRELARHCRSPLPTTMPENARRIVGQPGTVVYLPAGVLHATSTQTASMSLLFTIRFATKAQQIARQVKHRLDGLEALQLSPLEQRGELRAESLLVARELRAMAAELELDAKTLSRSSPRSEARAHRARDLQCIRG